MVVRKKLLVFRGLIFGLLAFPLFTCGDALTEEAGQEIDLVSFEAYLAKVRSDAVAQGIRSKTVDVAFAELAPDPRVIKFDRRQPEFVQTFEEYLTARVSEARVSQAQRYYEDKRSVLSEIADRYGVDPEYLIAFWGLESSFGRYQGKYDVIRSLATLGHDQRRSRFFTSELHAALRILDEEHVTRETFVGGWAGAMGQNQFLPSTFNNFAVDYDQDGRKDIWSNKLDVWASIANYLQRHGWQRGAGWGFSTSAPTVFPEPSAMTTGCRALRQHSKKLKLSEWKSYGVDVPAGEPRDNALYALIKPQSGDSDAYLVGGNFRAILSYNCANKYAVSVGLLAELIVPS